MLRHPLTSTFLIALLLITHLNCVVEHQLIPVPGPALGIEGREANETPQPADHDHEECHGSGCICEGATLANAFVFDASPLKTVCLYLSNAAPGIIGGHAAPRLLDATLPVRPRYGGPLRALERCAWQQSFLI